MIILIVKALRPVCLFLFFVLFYGASPVFCEDGVSKDKVFDPLLRSKIELARSTIDSHLSVALKIFELDIGAYPTTEQGLKALMDKNVLQSESSNWKGPYLQTELIDPWGKPYQYRSPGTRSDSLPYDLWSWGPDGIESEDDISNQEPYAESVSVNRDIN